MNHTPLPWYVEESTHHFVRVCRDDAKGKTEIVADCYKNDDKTDAESNAALIVRAVNNHQKLVDAVKALLPTEEAKLSRLEKRPYAIGLTKVRENVESARALLAELEQK